MRKEEDIFVQRRESSITEEIKEINQRREKIVSVEEKEKRVQVEVRLKSSS